MKADSSDDNSLPPPYTYSIIVSSMLEVWQVYIAYPTWPQSLTVWSTGNQSLSFFDPVDLTATISVAIKRVQLLPLLEIKRAAQGSANKTACP